MSPNNETISPLRLLLLEDNPADADLVIAELRRAGLFLEVLARYPTADERKAPNVMAGAAPR